MDKKIAEKFEEVIELRQSLSDETDRGCALMAASYLDSQLEQLLRKRLVNDSKILDGLLSSAGPLGTFSSRIDLTYLLGLISKAEHKDLHLIRKIRNDFGHVAKKIALDEGAIKSRCDELYYHGLPNDAPPRHKFIRVVLWIAATIHAAIWTIEHIRPKENEEIDDTVKQLNAALLQQVLTTLGIDDIEVDR